MNAMRRRLAARAARRAVARRGRPGLPEGTGVLLLGTLSAMLVIVAGGAAAVFGLLRWWLGA